MGPEGLVALLGYVMMAVSVFLPWVTFAAPLPDIGITLQRSSSLLQLFGGISSMIFLGVAVVGALATLLKKQTSSTGLGDVVLGFIVLLQTGYEMSFLASESEKLTTPDVTVSLGSGAYLALAASLLIMVAGIATVIKVRSNRTRQTVRELHEYKPSTGLQGPFPLDEQAINEEVGTGSPGVYALGHTPGKTFFVKYFGRSDSDINAKLKEHIGKYDSFKFAYFDSPEAAFTKECELYHAFRGPEGRLDNKTHPERTAGTTWLCPNNAFDSVSAAQTKNQFCVNCRAVIPIGSEFCSKCGTAQT